MTFYIKPIGSFGQFDEKWVKNNAPVEWERYRLQKKCGQTNSLDFFNGAKNLITDDFGIMSLVILAVGFIPFIT